MTSNEKQGQSPNPPEVRQCGSARAKAKKPAVAATHTDAILPMTDDYMQQIVRREKTYEFRRYRISDSVKRVWFYLNAPRSAIVYICDIDSARTRNPGDPALPEDGAGNREFNTRHRDWDKYDFAYRVRSVRQLSTPIDLKVMKERYGIKGAPRGLVYVPPSMLEDVHLEAQELLWAVDDGVFTPGSQDGSSGKRKEHIFNSDQPPAKRTRAATSPEPVLFQLHVASISPSPLRESVP
ncbi:hypothetical protein C8Q76DRAFT_49600 [Earliella scabrosa]|nr:hypothetical protein C8Q76DRAFT_49600 [Earliella scabrosa]